MGITKRFLKILDYVRAFLANVLRVQLRFARQTFGELLHAYPLGDLDPVHLQDVRLARADLDEAVLAVRADVWLLPRVGHAVVLEGVQGPELELAQVAGQTLLAVRLHVVLQVRLDLEALAALLADEGAGGVRVDPQHVPLRLRLGVEVPPAHRALVVVPGLRSATFPAAAAALAALPILPVVLDGWQFNKN